MSSNLTEQTRIRMIIEDQIRRLDAIYKVTCSSKDYLGWKKQGLSEKELLLLEQRLGKIFLMRNALPLTYLNSAYPRNTP